MCGYYAIDWSRPIVTRIPVKTTYIHLFLANRLCYFAWNIGCCQRNEWKAAPSTACRALVAFIKLFSSDGASKSSRSDFITPCYSVSVSNYGRTHSS